MVSGSSNLDTAEGPDGQPLKVLFISALGRSGSTIIGNILGESPGIFHAGELRTLWGRGLLRDRLCGCGVPVGTCDFWRSVLTEAFGDLELAQRRAKEIDEWHRTAVRLRYLPRILRESQSGPRQWTALCRYLDAAERLYKALAHAASARTIIDSSKHPTDAAVLRLLPGIEPYYVQLVRDPRAVAYSWQRRKASPGEGPEERMGRIRPSTTARNWLVINVAAEAIRRRHGTAHSQLLRYETFAAAPRATIEHVLTSIGEQRAETPFLEDGSVRLSPGHTAGGNPNRFNTGSVQISEDSEWERKQPIRDRLVSTAITLPLLKRYGYPIWPR